jgi:hypothetical protein
VDEPDVPDELEVDESDVPDELEVEEDNGLFGGSIRLLYICFLYYF